MEKVIIIDVPNAKRAMTEVLGLPILVRTIKTLLSAGVEKIELTGQEALEVLSQLPQSVSLAKAPNHGILNLSADFHYDPSLLKDLLKEKPASLEALLPRLPENLWHSLDKPHAVKS